VMNRVVSRKLLDEVRFAQVRAAFARALPQLAAATPAIDEPGKENGR
jgi:DNA-directed RNA polymerase subunit K/omega